MELSVEQKEEYMNRAAFGKQIELFWGSRIGEYLRDRAQECYTKAVQNLKSVDPSNSQLIQKYQNEVWLAESFETWLTEAMTDGMKSLDLLQYEAGEENVD